MANAKIDVLLQMRADLRAVLETQTQLKAATAAMSEFWQTVRLGANLQIGAYLAQGLANIPNLLRQGANAGIAFNAQLETAQLGIAAVLKQFDDAGKYRTFGDATTEAGRALDRLKEKARTSSATLSELTEAYQGTAGAMASAGLSVRQQVDLISLMSQTLGGLGIASNQILQESRAIVTGNINANAAAAQILQISRQDILQAKEAGTLFEFLMGKMDSFRVAAERGKTTWNQLTSNMKDGLDQMAAAIAQPLFDNLKSEIQSFSEMIDSGQLTDELRVMARNIADVTSAAIKGAAFMLQYSGAIAAVTQALIAFTVAAKAAAMISMMGGIFGGISGSLTALPALIARVGLSLRLLFTTVSGAGAVAVAGVLAVSWWKNWRLEAINAIDAVRQAVSAPMSSLARDMLSISTEGERAAALEQANALAAQMQERIAKLREEGRELTGEARYSKETGWYNVRGDFDRGNLDKRQQEEYDALLEASADLQKRIAAIQGAQGDTLIQRNAAERTYLDLQRRNAEAATTLATAEEDLARFRFSQLSLDDQITAKAQERARLSSERRTIEGELTTLQERLASGAGNELSIKEAIQGAQLRLTQNTLDQERAQTELVRLTDEHQKITEQTATAEANHRAAEQAAAQKMIELRLEGIRLERLFLENKAAGGRLSMDERRQLTNLVADEKRVIDELIAHYRTLSAAAGLSSADRQAYANVITALEQAKATAGSGSVAPVSRIDEARQRGAAMQKGEGFDSSQHYGNFSDAIEGGALTFMADLGTQADIANRAFLEMANSGLQAVKTGMYDIITSGGKLKDVGLALAQDLTRSFISAGVDMVAQWTWQHGVMAGIRKLFNIERVAETAATQAAETGAEAAGSAARVGIAGAEEGAKTGFTLSGSIARGAIRVGETAFEILQFPIRVAAFLASETLKTAGALAGAAIRAPIVLAEAMGNIIVAATGAMAAMAAIPFIGPVLAVAAGAAMLGAGIALVGQIAGFEKGGLVTGGRQVVQINEAGEEFVVNHRATKENLPLLKALNAGVKLDQMQGILPVSYAGAAPAVMVSGAGGGQGNTRQSGRTAAKREKPPLQVLVYSREEAYRVVKGHPDYEADITDVVYRRRGKMI